MTTTADFCDMTHQQIADTLRKEHGPDARYVSHFTGNGEKERFADATQFASFLSNFPTPESVYRCQTGAIVFAYATGAPDPEADAWMRVERHAAEVWGD